MTARLEEVAQDCLLQLTFLRIHLFVVFFNELITLYLVKRDS